MQLYANFHIVLVSSLSCGVTEVTFSCMRKAPKNCMDVNQIRTKIGTGIKLWTAMI